MKRIDEFKEQQQKNKELVGKYPWLIPRNRFTGDIVKDYDYEFTELDDMPFGWQKAFGEQMCEEIHEELVKEKFVDEYRIQEIKEKYGRLRWYSGPLTKKIIEIVRKYEDLSEQTCIKCGEPAKWMTHGWIMPLCDTCARDRFKNPKENCTEISEYLSYME